jgi:hypothetical protein
MPSRKPAPKTLPLDVTPDHHEAAAPVDATPTADAHAGQPDPVSGGRILATMSHPESPETLRAQIAELQQKANAVESEKARAIVADLRAQATAAAEAIARVEAEEAASRQEARAQQWAELSVQFDGLVAEIRANHEKIDATLARFADVEALARSILAESNAALDANAHAEETFRDLAAQAAALGFKAPQLGQCRTQSNWRLGSYMAGLALRRAAHGGSSCIGPIVAASNTVPIDALREMRFVGADD